MPYLNELGGGGPLRLPIARARLRLLVSAPAPCYSLCEQELLMQINEDKVVARSDRSPNARLRALPASVFLRARAMLSALLRLLARSRPRVRCDDGAAALAVSNEENVRRSCSARLVEEELCREPSKNVGLRSLCAAQTAPSSAAMRGQRQSHSRALASRNIPLSR